LCANNIESALPSIAAPAFKRVTVILRKLGRTPPQALLLEGGRENERLDAARYWAARCNCPHLDVLDAPCLDCPVCRQIMAGEYSDLFLYDGRISNTDDQDNLGVIRAFAVETTRLLKRRLREAPHNAGRRVVVIMGIDQNRAGAANAMLKLLEDPLPDTIFVLLAPQREQLLPTLVSRSFCLMLPWPDIHAQSGDTAAWEEKLAGFLRDGKDFLEEVAARGAVDARLAERLLLACQKACGAAFPLATPGTALDNTQPKGSLRDTFARLDARGLTLAIKWIFEAQETLRLNVMPARVLEALAARLFGLVRSIPFLDKNCIVIRKP
jgi:DNA polymerase-3 subunit delta'